MKTIRVTHPMQHVGTAEVTVWPLNAAHKTGEYAGRFVVAIHSGCATMHLRPTKAEMIELRDAIDAAIAGAADAPRKWGINVWNLTPEGLA
ncbi:MAG TPA: hypothetical protein VLD59_08220 [Steroidobacteraceae bacterium]|nr:hypothetical protein [Steroidobacteraceae bacterium]